ncbi:HEAT repeat domain-containing protein [Streptomyces sp. Ncost-T10-10d]|uniref:HEAT repeat domain-containing protein n=1 Tax=Streptomyces sp. Ncost-T10-10d TaxID=1839774 RepID=UPI00081E5861|nr:HEAT repeat domain-containing protein [Streptomyces sp. Ncost-T10-10d]SCF85750.1 HEAT repeat-containing protein [Streptomyces sp. Ncost-T10-10d]
MAMFVHLTPMANAARIRRSGIRATSHGRDGSRGLYCFPVLPSYTLTHQWLRELARHGGPRGLVAVHIRLPDDEPVTLGRYNGSPAATSAAEAVRRTAALDDPRGWEVFVPRAVTKREVHRLRTVKQVTGWRYFPDSNGRTPCTCFGCRVRGEYGSQRLRRRRPHPLDGPAPATPVLLRRIAAAGNPGDASQLTDTLYWFGMRRRGPVDQLAHLADHPDPRVREALVRAVANWSTPGVTELLHRLAQDPDADVREAVESTAPEQQSQ